MTDSIIMPGSVAALARAQGGDLAMAWSNVDIVFICDTSGSMSATDVTDIENAPISRYERLCLELGRLQAKQPGRFAIITFSDHAEICFSGRPRYIGSGTRLSKALEYAKIADGTIVRFVLLSDGHPDNPEAALQVARTYTTPIDTIYIGPEGGSGQDFLMRLSAAVGGSYRLIAEAKDLANEVTKFLPPPRGA